MAEADVRRLLDESDIRDLALRYAEAVDGLDMPALAALFTEDGVIEGSGVNMKGRAQIAKVEETMRANHDRTYHMVYNHLVRLDGDSASGTVYSRSHHLKRRDDGTTRDLIMTITYNDRYVRQGGVWLIAHREIDLKWTEVRQVQGEAKVR